VHNVQSEMCSELKNLVLTLTDKYWVMIDEKVSVVCSLVDDASPGG
jgi:hypothetical protein